MTRMSQRELDELIRNHPQLRVVEQRQVKPVPLPEPAKRANKYGAQKTEFGGRTYDSKAEAHRARDLLLLRNAGEIQNLAFQPIYALPGGISYRLDFEYREGGKIICEDVKGYSTPVFRLKRRLFLETYPDIELRITDKHGNVKPLKRRRATSATRRAAA